MLTVDTFSFGSGIEYSYDCSTASAMIPTTAAIFCINEHATDLPWFIDRSFDTYLLSFSIGIDLTTWYWEAFLNH